MKKETKLINTKKGFGRSYGYPEIKMKENEIERIERLEYNEKIKDIMLMGFAIIILISIGVIILI